MELIWGIQVNEVLLLLKQIGLAVAGAASLWGFIFSLRRESHPDKPSWIVDDWISMKLFYLFAGSLALFAISHFLSLFVTLALAHEGISIGASVPEIIATFPLVNLLFYSLALFSLVMIFLLAKNETKFSFLLRPFYAGAFCLIFFMISFYAWRGEFDREQVFHFMHGFHSIFTLGSVIVLDFLFLISYRSELLKQHIYSLFPTISKVVWAGLCLDFLSVFLISDYFVVTEKLLFTQTVIAILIVNGTLLSGPISRKMMVLAGEEGNHQSISVRLRRVASICGALSITSWLTITSLDFFKNLTLGYLDLLLLYIAFFILAFLGHLLFEHIESRKAPASE